MNEQLCEMCGLRQATIFYKQTINGVTMQKRLCAECAKKLQTDGSAGFWNPIDFLNDFIAEKRPRGKMRVCKCGTTEEEVLRLGKFGCDECYKTFSDIADKYIHGMGGATKHNGKHPDAVPDTLPKVENKELSELERLKRKLEKAVEEEDFLLAADLKKKIIALEAKEK